VNGSLQAAASASRQQARPLDPDSRRWLEDLAADPPADEALRRLHALLLRAARFELARRRTAVPWLDGDERERLALECADDALVAVLARRATYRGQSRFTTWAYKFALLEAAVQVRRLAWRGREIALPAEGWTLVPDRAPTQHEQAEQHELVEAVRDGVASALTPHQRDVLVALTIDDVPIDVLAERLGSSRGALYKTLHDARKRLRDHLAGRGLPQPPRRPR
jgi:RNA polymerase sigma-70 factor (ECF subfamily)